MSGMRRGGKDDTGFHRPPPNVPPSPYPVPEEPSSSAAGNLSVNGQDVQSIVYDQICDVLFVLEVERDGRYRFTSVNHRFEATTGLPATQVIGRYVEDIIPEPSLTLVKEKYRQAINGRQPVHWDEVSDYPNGTKVGEVTVTPVHTTDGTCCELVGSVHDVTDRYRMQAQLQELEERWRLALEASEAAAWDWDRASSCVSLSPQWKHILGRDWENFYPSEQIADALLHPHDRAAVVDSLHKCSSGREDTIQIEARIWHADGRWLWVRCRGKAIRNHEGEIVRMLGTGTDISMSKATDNMLQLASLVFRHSTEAISILDPSGKILAINPAFTTIRGYTEEDILGKTPRTYDTGPNARNFYDSVWKEVVSTGHWKGEIWSRHKDGRIIAELRSVNAVMSGDGTVRHYIEMAVDMTKSKNSEELLWKQTNYDGLTGLPNRHLFLDRLRQATRYAHRAAPAFTLLFIDLDRFKDVNDILGHGAGDRLLQEAAKRLLGCTREMDTVGRLGGDEFTVLVESMHNSDSEDPYVIDRVASAIVQAMATPFQVDTETLHLSASVGIAHFPKDATCIESLLKHAEQAMYEAKRKGRNRYAYFSQAMQEKAQARRHLVDDLRCAIAGGQIQVYYQPIVDFASGKLAKAEALVRWHHPERGVIMPTEFIPLCEETGLIVEIGEWVFHQVVSSTARWIDELQADLQISVNVSPMQLLMGRESCERCLHYHRARKLPDQAIIVEVTEGLFLHGEPAAEAQLSEWLRNGIALAIDDFGTGYSAMSYLQRYQFQFLKIDRSFVQHLELQSTNKALCETIITMAHKLGMRVVAEGIETPAQYEFLSEAGCDFGQGYYFSRPVPADAFERMLRDHAP